MFFGSVFAAPNVLLLVDESAPSFSVTLVLGLGPFEKDYLACTVDSFVL